MEMKDPKRMEKEEQHRTVKSWYSTQLKNQFGEKNPKNSNSIFERSSSLLSISMETKKSP